MRAGPGLPAPWLTPGSRTSLLAPGGNGRHAVTPAQALLNFGYAVLEGEVRVALAGAGFDLACGFLHADKPGRDSLVYDVLEPFRGVVDALVVRFIEGHMFNAAHFVRVRNGSVRLHPALARAFVEERSFNCTIFACTSLPSVARRRFRSLQ
jgi:CRISPR/Cas system-associated endonuclease Cas1